MKKKTSPAHAKAAVKIEVNSMVKGSGVPNETRPLLGEAAHVDTPELRSFLAKRPDRKRRTPESSELVSKAQPKSLKKGPAAPFDQRMLEYARRITRPLD